MKSTLYVLKYNNYFNRLFKRENTLSDYLTNDYLQYTDVNFVPNDGVNTGIILPIQDYNDYDYLLVVENNIIISRWFIVDSKRTRTNQYQLSLKRDTLVDYYDDIKDDYLYVDKAILPKSNTLIFNEENMSFNQIKKAEFPLKDTSGCAWICGYVALPKADGTNTFNIDIKYSDKDYDLETASLTSWPFYKYVTSNSLTSVPLSRLFFDVKVNDSYIGGIMGTQGDGFWAYQSTVTNPSTNYYVSTGKYLKPSDIIYNFTKQASKVPYDLNSYLNILTKAEYDSILALDGKRLKDTSSNCLTGSSFPFCHT